MSENKRKKLIRIIICALLLCLILVCSFNYNKNHKKTDKVIDYLQSSENSLEKDEENEENIENEENVNDNNQRCDNTNIVFNENDKENKYDYIDNDNNGEVDISEDESKYVFGEKVPESETVTDDYFSDAVFIGNSQIEGILLYKSMKNATIYGGKGIMVNTIFTKQVIKNDDSERITIMDALSKNKFKKVYIMLGANELGWEFDYIFIEQYGKVIDEVKKLQPDALIYVNAIMPVSKGKDTKDKIYNNTNIENFNKLILQMTKEKEAYYIDSKEAMADENGYLPDDAGHDGVHLNAEYYEKWFNYLKTHTVQEI
ncbi:hypothetical protein JYG23_11125 [Sedimentibacter sp. zth1]|uniref:GDSL-type esterase/lipase family protein n=1 Tax=Sedimentibacter sp. zth1 TaxID=2816908 RepID=UPI001A930E1A|nr:GDSL-type esterase/lipase family protein [Sedimentibacter sp. zth1]QSX05226.1 hypothetical protein JYG23_11125 [Sedimentibacter sp. zth1]